MRILGFLLVGALAVILAPSSGLTQIGPPGGGGGPPGGFGGGGFRPPDPNQTWERMAGGKDSITRADVADQRMQFVFDMTVRSQGITNGVLTKQQFIDASQKFMQQMAAGGMRGFGGGGGRNRGRGQMSPGGMPGGIPAMSPTGPNAIPGGGDPTEAMFRKMDQNGDGFLNSDEMPEDLRASLAQWDANKDGMIDLNEFKEYMKAKGQQGQAMPTWIQEETPEEEEQRPVTYHAGNLPKELLTKAPWFQELDKDNDAQIGLYEWKDSGRPLEEFQKMDRNGDGYLTVEEVLYYFAAQDKATAKLKGGSKNVASASAGPGGPRGFGGPGRPGGGMPGGPAPDAAEPSPGSAPPPVQSYQAPTPGGDQTPRGPRTGGGGGSKRRGGGGGQGGPGRQ
jgi:Ca2+-binding EF-hand superfamily protein